MAQARALVYVSRHEGVRQIDLAEMLEIQPITLTRLIDQLATSGLVERRGSPTDRRAYQIHLLPAASQHLAIIEEVAGAVRAEAVSGFNEQQAAELIFALRKIRSNLAPARSAS